MFIILKEERRDGREEERKGGREEGRSPLPFLSLYPIVSFMSGMVQVWTNQNSPLEASCGDKDSLFLVTRIWSFPFHTNRPIIEFVVIIP